MKMKILAIHGWLHAAELYLKLCNALDSLGHLAETYEFPGYGETPKKYEANLLENYAHDLAKCLKDKEYDVVIAHSMGADILLRALNEVATVPHVILLAPVYGRLFEKQMNIPVKYLKGYLKFFMKYDWSIKILLGMQGVKETTRSKEMATILRKANLDVAAECCHEMLTGPNEYKVYNVGIDYTVIAAEDDRLVSTQNKEKLYKALNYYDKYVIGEVGHCLITEAYDKVLFYIKEKLEDYK